MKIDNEIITSHDIEQEINYLKALNPRLNQINKDELLIIAKKSLIKEFIKRKEIEKYKKLNLENAQINNVLNNLIQNLNLQNESELESYLNAFNFSLEELKKKIEIENEWKNLIYSKYIKTVKINEKELIDKIERSSREKFLLEYNLSEIVFTNTKDVSLKQLFENVQESIKKNGFENTANLYSISESSKVGGKIGWVKKFKC
jgi:peptidyl-prolyl cis-trans isomerase SurA